MKISKESIIRVIILFVGLTVAHLGVSLFLLADLGTDPFNVLVQGVFRSIQSVFQIGWLTHGKVHRIICFIIILVLLLVDKSYVRIGTLICMFCGGPIIDFFTAMLSPLVAAGPSIYIRLIMNAVGCVILAMGMTVVIQSEAGTGPNDLVAVVLSDKTGVRFSLMRVIVDVVFTAVGWLLGGSVGVGTLICAFLVGPVAGFFMPKSKKIVQDIVGRFVKA